MAKICEISGKITRFGNNRSDANNRTRRRFYVNLQTKKIYLPEVDTWLTICASTSVLRTISRKGWLPTFKKAYAKGTLNKRLWCLVG